MKIEFTFKTGETLVIEGETLNQTEEAVFIDNIVVPKKWVKSAVSV
jgi:hypothetical protein